MLTIRYIRNPKMFEMPRYGWWHGCPIIQAKQRASAQEKEAKRQQSVRDNEWLAIPDAVRSAIVVKRKRKCKRWYVCIISMWVCKISNLFGDSGRLGSFGMQNNICIAITAYGFVIRLI